MFVLVYKDALTFLKKCLLIGQAAFLCIRVFSQIMFSMPTAFCIVQFFLSFVIYYRFHCRLEAQLHMIFTAIILYILIINKMADFSGVIIQKNLHPYLIQNFTNNYKQWVYYLQAIFRVFAMVIAWRCFQFSQIYQGLQNERQEYR